MPTGIERQRTMVATKQKFFRNEVVDGQVVSSYFMELFGLSTETKPTTHGGNIIAEGSTFFEEDTSKAFIMKADHTWVEI